MEVPQQVQSEPAINQQQQSEAISSAGVGEPTFITRASRNTGTIHRQHPQQHLLLVCTIFLMIIYRPNFPSFRSFNQKSDKSLFRQIVNAKFRMTLYKFESSFILRKIVH